MLWPMSLSPVLVAAPITATATLVAVYVGSRLSRKTEIDKWLRDQRLESYLNYLDLLMDMHEQFLVGLKVSKFRVDEAIEHGHSFEGVEQAWSDQMSDLNRLERRLQLLGRRVKYLHDESGSELVGEMIEAIYNPDIPEEEWDEIGDRLNTYMNVVLSGAQRDLGIDDPLRRRDVWGLRWYDLRHGHWRMVFPRRRKT